MSQRQRSPFRWWCGIAIAVNLLFAVRPVAAEKPSKSPAVADDGKSVTVPGLIPNPRPLPGGKRWQIMTRWPRGTISCLELSPDDREVAYADEAIVRICDSRTFALKRTLVGHRDRVLSIAWNRAAPKIATASADGTVGLWKPDGTPLAQLRGHEDAVTQVVWSRDGQQIASCGRDGTVRLWSAAGKPGKVIRISDAPLTSIAFNPDGTRLVVGNENREVHIVKADGTTVALCEGHFSAISAVDWSADGKWIASGCHGIANEDSKKTIANVHLWDTSGTLKQSLRGYTRPINSLAFDPSGNELAVLSEGAEIKIWSPSGSLVEQFFGDGEGKFRWTSDSKGFVVSGKQVLRRVDRSTASALPYSAPGPFFATRLRFETAAWSPDGSRIAATTIDGRARIYSAAGRTEVTIQPQSAGETAAVAWGPDGKQIVVVNRHGKVRLFDVAGKLVRELPIQGLSERVAWSSDGRIAVREYYRFHVIKSDGSDDHILDPGQAKKLEALAFSPNGSLVASSGIGGIVRLWDRTGTLQRAIDCLSPEACAVSWAPNGKWLAVGLDGGSWGIWQADGQEKGTFGGDDESIEAIAVDPSGTRIVTGGWGSKLQMWSPEGDLLGSFPGHIGAILTVSWSPDGKHFVTCSRDNTMRIWNAGTRTCEAVVLAMTDGTTASFSATGERISGEKKPLESDLHFLVEADGGRYKLLTSSQFGN